MAPGESSAPMDLGRDGKHHAYGTMYGVKRTTVYLKDDQKQQLEEIAARTADSEAELIRLGVDRVIEEHRLRRRKPRVLFALDDPVLDDPDRIGEALEGFGED
jgi:hypothetical protein